MSYSVQEEVHRLYANVMSFYIRDMSILGFWSRVGRQVYLEPIPCRYRGTAVYCTTFILSISFSWYVMVIVFHKGSSLQWTGDVKHWSFSAGSLRLVGQGDVKHQELPPFPIHGTERVKPPQQQSPRPTHTTGTHGGQSRRIPCRHDPA